MKKQQSASDVDIVVFWVDGSDKKWLEKKKKYKPELEVDDEINRYRDWGFFKYWFRGIEENADWVRKVFLVTDHQVPEWLNKNNPKLELINHEDYIDKKYLPLFNSSAIECTVNKIPGLSEKFILFNDDMFVISKTKENDFFRKGIPRDIYIESPTMPRVGDDVFSHILINNLYLVNKLYDKKNIIMHPLKYLNPKYGAKIIKTVLLLPYKNIAGFLNPHIPQPFLRSSFERLQEMNGEKFEQCLKNRFRSKDDITQYAPRYYQLITGKFAPQSKRIGKNIEITADSIGKICDFIVNQRTKTICINDTDIDVDYSLARSAITEAFEKRFPNKSTYER